MRNKRAISVNGVELQRFWERIQSLPEEPAGEHLSVAEIRRYLAGTVAQGDFDRWDAHLSSCSLCASAADEMDLASPEPPATPPSKDRQQAAETLAGAASAFAYGERAPVERHRKLVVDELLAKPSTVVPTLVVGVGGSGCRMVARIASHLRSRQDFEERYRSRVRFALFDANVNDLEGYRELADETFLFSDFEKEEYANLASGKLFLEADPYFTQWFPPNYRFRASTSGAGQHRLESRLGFFYQAKHKGLAPRSQRLLEDLNRHEHGHRRLDSAEIRIVLCFSVAGGTGSGCHLPIAYMLRDLARQVGKPKMIGAAVLPSVFEDKTGVNRDGIFANGYAALKEMEHLMKLGAPESRFYPNEGLTFHYDPSDESKRTVRERPFEFLYIIDKPDSFNVAEPVDAAADGLYLQLFSPLFGAQTSDYDDYTQHQRFLVPHDFEAKGMQGFSTFYGSFGASVLQVPVASLVDYCTWAAGLHLMRAFVGARPGGPGKGFDVFEQTQLRRLERLREEGGSAAHRYVQATEALRIEDGRRMWDFYYADRVAGLPELTLSHPRVRQVLEELAPRLDLFDGGPAALEPLFSAFQEYAREVLHASIAGDRQGRGGLTLQEALELEVVYRTLYRSHLPEIAPEGHEAIRRIIQSYRSLPDERKVDLADPLHRDYLREKVQRIAERSSLLCAYDDPYSSQGGVRPDEIFLVAASDEVRGTHIGKAIQDAALRISWVTEGWNNSQEIIFYRAVLNVPLYAFGRMGVMKEAYERFRRMGKRSRTLHIDRNWEEGLADLDPVSVQEKHSQSLVRKQILNFAALLVTPNLQRPGHGYIMRREGLYWLCDPTLPGSSGRRAAGGEVGLVPLGVTMTESIKRLPEVLQAEKVKYDAYQQMLRTVRGGLAPQVLALIAILPVQWRRYAEELRTLYGSNPTADDLERLRDYEDSYWRLFESLEDVLDRLRNKEIEQKSLGADAGTILADLSQDEARAKLSQSISILRAFSEQWRQMENPGHGRGRSVSSSFSGLFKRLPEDEPAWEVNGSEAEED